MRSYLKVRSSCILPPPPPPWPVLREKPADIDTYTHCTGLLVRIFSTSSLPTSKIAWQRLSLNNYISPSTFSLNGSISLSFLPATTTTTCPRCSRNKTGYSLSLMMMICFPCYTCIDNNRHTTITRNPPSPGRLLRTRYIIVDAETATQRTQPTSQPITAVLLFRARVVIVVELRS